MTKEQFRQWIDEEKVVLLDGATGSNLQRRGMPSGVCPEKWIADNREVLLGLQREFVEAGSNIIFAPTFTGNRIKLAEYGLEGEAGRLHKELVAISKEAAKGRALVAGDVSMTGEQLAPVGTMEFETLVDIYKEQIGCLEEAGVDLLIVETMMSLQEARAALIAAKEVCSLPVMVSLTYREDGRTLYGTDPVTALVVLQSLGADAVGMNCSTGPDRMIEYVRQMKPYARVPILIKPNAGLPALRPDGTDYYDMDADTFADYMVKAVEAGASLVGGCCGTTPEYIKKLKGRLAGFSKRRVPAADKAKAIRALASERKTLALPLDGSFKIVGERINPTGKKALQAELIEGSYELVKKFAREQEQCGASLLDVNVGMSGIDEKEVMLRAIEQATMATDLPLCLDSSNIEVLEAALRRYPGRALINSVSLEKEKFERLLPIVKKYGAMFILLPLSDAGLPESLAKKKEIIHKILDRALALGMEREDIVVDGLVTTVGANKKAALETLETIRYCREELKLATVVGLSNISFGLPERAYVNSTFLTMAIQAGLTMAIANPSQELLVCSGFAADLLLGKEGADTAYIGKANRLRAKEETLQKPAVGSEAKAAAEPSWEEKLYEAVLSGNRKDIPALVEHCLKKGSDASQLLGKVLIPAINEVGELFDCKEYFLPQLIASAEAMKEAIARLEPLLLAGEAGKERTTIVMATVKGDIHDIGKNLVVMMLKNYGYRVIDLGKDVPKEEIVRTAMEEQAAIIGLSALMTTTMQEMRAVVNYAKEQHCTAKIIIGGAVVTEGYAKEIGADGYSGDAAAAVRLVKRLLKPQEGR